MRHTRFGALIAMVLMMLSATRGTGSALGWRPVAATAAPAPAPVAAVRPQPQAAVENVKLRLLGIDLGARARYAATIERPRDAAMSNVRLVVALPQGAAIAEVMALDRRTRFEGVDGGRLLTWTAAEIPAAEDTVSFAFSLERAVEGDIVAQLTWDGAEDGVDAVFRGPLQLAATVSGEVTFTTTDYVPVGDTGMLIAPLSADLIGTTVQVRKPGNDENPPEAAASGLWWCAMAEVLGLPEGSAVSLLLPLRQPLSADSTMALFGKSGDTWEELNELALVTPGGQFVGFRHTGGLRAAGTAAANRQIPVLRQAANPNPDMFVFGSQFDPAAPLAAGSTTTFSVIVQNLSSQTSPAGQQATVVFDGPFTITAVPAAVSATCTQQGARQLTCSITPLSFGAGAILIATVRADNPGTTAIQACAQTAAAFQPNEANTTNNSEQLCATINAGAAQPFDLQVQSVTSNKTSIEAGFALTERAQITTVVRNNGPAASPAGATVLIDPADGLALTAQQQTLPAGVNCTVGAGNRSCTLPAIATGQTLTIITTVRGVTAGANRCVIATVTAAGDANAANNSGQVCLTVTAPPTDLSVNIERTGPQAAVGQETTYRISVKAEQGTSSGQVVIAAAFDGPFDLVSITGTGTAPGTWTCATLGNTSVPSRLCSITQTVTAPNSYLPLDFRVRLRDCSDVNLHHQVSMTGGGDTTGTNNLGTLDEVTACPKLQLTLTQSDAIVNMQLRDKQTYTIGVKNVGGAATSGPVTVTFRGPGTGATRWFEGKTASPCGFDQAAITGLNEFANAEFDVTCILTSAIAPGATVTLPEMSARLGFFVTAPFFASFETCLNAAFDAVGIDPTSTATASGGGAQTVTKEIITKFRICARDLP